MKKVMVIIATLLLIGCSVKINPNASSQQLISEGKVLMENGKYSIAAEAFEYAILNSYSPKEAEEAQLLKGEAYFKDERYVEAIATYEIFYDLYGGDKDAYTLHQLAMSYYYLSPNPGRDQTFTLKSLNYLQTLEILYPDYFIFNDMDKYKIEMIDKLAQTDYDVALYYIRTNHYESATIRLIDLIGKYPNTYIAEKAFEKLIEASSHIDGREHIIPDYIAELELINPNNDKLSYYKSKYLK